MFSPRAYLVLASVLFVLNCSACVWARDIQKSRYLLQVVSPVMPSSPPPNFTQPSTPAVPGQAVSPPSSASPVPSSPSPFGFPPTPPTPFPSSPSPFGFPSTPSTPFPSSPSPFGFPPTPSTPFPGLSPPLAPPAKSNKQP